MSKKTSKEEAAKKALIKLKKTKVKIKDAQAASGSTNSTGPRFKNKDTGL